MTAPTRTPERQRARVYAWAPPARRRPPVMRVLPNLLLGPYALSVFLITLLPASQAGKVTGVVDALASWIDARVPQLQSYALLEFLANVALFVPLGVLLRWGWPRVPWWMITLVGLAMTVTIESVQTMLPSRFPAISDVIANTAGTAVGGLLVTIQAKVFRRR
ncbi:VanZ family protein [Microbacterium sp. OR16]|uniref:VanZ family protein n=1 Tax=Microbacterium sp. OR16 TaxID=3095345 RepID=UPI0039B6B11F